MKKLAPIALAALFALTACGSINSADDEPQSENIDPAEDTAPSDGSALESSPDGYTMQVRYYWVPDEPDAQPVEARFHMRAPTDENTYVTEGLSYDVLPSFYAEDYYQHTFFMEDGDSLSARGSAHDTPTDGHITCLLVEEEQQIILDYQESDPDEDAVSCYGYAPDVVHDHEPGTPPKDFPVPF